MSGSHLDDILDEDPYSRGRRRPARPPGRAREDHPDAPIRGGFTPVGPGYDPPAEGALDPRRPAGRRSPRGTPPGYAEGAYGDEAYDQGSYHRDAPGRDATGRNGHDPQLYDSLDHDSLDHDGQNYDGQNYDGQNYDGQNYDGPDYDGRDDDENYDGRPGYRGDGYPDDGPGPDGYAQEQDADGGGDDRGGTRLGGWDDEPVPRRRPRTLTKLVAVLVVVAALLGIGIFAVGKVVGRIGGPSAPADYVGVGEGLAFVQIPEGASVREIGQELREADVTRSVAAFVSAAATNPKALGIQPGTYRLRNQMSAEAALAALLNPASSAPFRFTIKEGMSVQQVLQGLHERLGTPMAELETIAHNPKQLGVPAYAPTLEGYLFPSTYDLVPGATPVQLLTSFVSRFRQEAAGIDLERQAAARNVRPADIVTIASIIEKEVANADEGPKAARVIYNRLNDTTGAFRRIDMDSTTRYALQEYTGPLTAEQLQRSNPYNTRRVAGLPPGAISNPGVWALKSALAPADGSWLYFVSMPQSRVTKFATTQAEWDQLVAQYKAEGGRE